MVLNLFRYNALQAIEESKPVPGVKTDRVTVLNFFYEQQGFQTNYRSLCKLNYDCIFTQDKFSTIDHWTNYSAIMIFGNPGISRLQGMVGEHGSKRDPKQVWIARGMESSASRLDFAGNWGFQNLFNYTAGLSRKATFQDSYFRIVEKKENKMTTADIKKEYNSFQKDKDFCWMVSQCRVYNQRFDMASEIINRLPGKFHMWGAASKKCMPKLNRSKIIDHGATKKKTKEYEQDLSKCKIYFSFENSNCTDYVTEKFSNALVYYAIPIVNGWRETYEQQLPGSFIHVSDFENIPSLVEYLTSLLVDREKFFAYHKWHLKYEVLREEPSTMYNLLNCKVCEKVYKTREANKNSMTQVETIPNLGQAFRSLEKCVPR